VPFGAFVLAEVVAVEEGAAVEQDLSSQMRSWIISPRGLMRSMLPLMDTRTMRSKLLM
jgi:hypothetical protein